MVESGSTDIETKSPVVAVTNGEVGEAAGKQEKEPLKVKEVIATKVSGVVKWFNPISGYGFINRSDINEDVFVHQSAIIKNNPKRSFRSLGQDEQVEFDVVIGEKGNEAANVTGPQGEAVKGNPYSYERRGYYRNGWYPRRYQRVGGPKKVDSKKGEIVEGGETEKREGEKSDEAGDERPAQRVGRRFGYRGRGGRRGSRADSQADRGDNEKVDDANGQNEKESTEHKEDGSGRGRGRGRGGSRRPYNRKSRRGPRGDAKSGEDAKAGGDAISGEDAKSGGDAKSGEDTGDTKSGGDAGDTKSGGDARDTKSGGDAGDTKSGADAGETKSGEDAGDTKSEGDAKSGGDAGGLDVLDAKC